MEPLIIKSNKFKFSVFKDKEEAFKHMANDMIDLIVENNKLNKNTLMIVPVGPIGQYTYFVDTVIHKEISLKQVTFINMDEYMIDQKHPLDKSHTLSFRKFMEDNVYSRIPNHLNILESNRIFPDPSHPEKVMDIISNHGYVDACYGGIGLNGHVAFNEPMKALSKKKFMELSTRTVNIANETLVTNSMNELDGAYDEMPKYAVTIGFKEILMSKKIRLYCFRPWHKSVIKKMMSNRPSTHFPASLLQAHHDLIIGLTHEILGKEF